MTEEYMEETNEEIGLEYDSNPVDTDRFVIDDDGKANWALQKIQEAKEEVERWRKYYQGNMEKIEKRQQGRIDYLMHLLRRYFNSIPHHTTKTQESYQLPSGQLVLKRPSPKFETDDSVLVGWLKESGLNDLIKTEVKEKPMWGELKKTVTINGNTVVTEDGEIVPGVKVLPQEESFEIK
jgi:hypothetical protein